MSTGMDVRPDDVLYIVAMRTRAPNRGRAVGEVMRVLSLGRADEAAEYVAHVTGAPLGEITASANDQLQALGFDFAAANEIVPVVVESHQKP